jgi:1-deoxy-D-xylulose-5-phosphate reductoisomerase
MGAVKRLAILGSTGSIGTSALAVVDSHRDRLSIVGLAARSSAAALGAQVARYRPSIAAIASEADIPRVRANAGAANTAIVAGQHALVEVATHRDVDMVLCASSGTAALEAVLAAIEAGKAIALANKEVLVMAGEMVMRAARKRGVPVLPVDSEHNAVHQCVHGRQSHEIKRVILTASGGPFRTWSSAALNDARPEDALRHPTWQMGRKITIDSATLMNKGLEVIEAHWLFDIPPDRIAVVVHPQSIVHSMVELTDGSTIAQLGVTDMRLPIQYAFSYPERWEAPLPPLDLARAGTLEFMPPDLERFPCLALAYRALRQGGTAMVALNAANEVAVEAFLAGRLAFPTIARIIDDTLSAHDVQRAETLEVVRESDRRARAHAANLASSLELKV